MLRMKAILRGDNLRIEISTPADKIEPIGLKKETHIPSEDGNQRASEILNF